MGQTVSHTASAKDRTIANRSHHLGLMPHTSSCRGVSRGGRQGGYDADEQLREDRSCEHPLSADQYYRVLDLSAPLLTHLIGLALICEQRCHRHMRMGKPDLATAKYRLALQYAPVLTAARAILAKLGEGRGRPDPAAYASS
jgi:hypothetical protein